MTIDARLPVYFAVEVDCYKPAVTGTPNAPGYGVAAHGTRAHGVGAITTYPDATFTIRASDVGYRTRSTDAGGLQVYPPLLAEAFQIDRKLNLDPLQNSVAYAWGTLKLSNAAGSFTGISQTSNSDTRGVRVYAYQQTYDAARRMWIDPPVASIVSFWQGLAGPWFLDEQTLNVPLRDASYWIENPLQSSFYTGAGALTGGADLAGKPIPKARGGTSANPICNVPAVLVDAVNLIYQYTDGPGTVVNLYEGGDTNITRQSDVADLYTGTTTAGQFRTCNAKGLFQLGSSPVRQITVDVTGQFPVAGVVTDVVSIAKNLLTEDMGVPTANVKASTFTAAATAYPYTAGAWFGTDATDGVSAVNHLLASINALLVPRRDGALGVFVLRAIPENTAPAASYDETQIVSAAPQQLPTTLDPPAYWWRVGYQHNYTVQTKNDNLSPNVTATRQTFLANADRSASWASTTVLTQYRRPNSPDVLTGALCKQADAQTVANDLGALWSATRRRLFQVTLPAAIGMQREIGDVVKITYPADVLASGALGQVVGDSFNSTDATISLLVLV